ncbi:MAG: glycine cleavage system aminomethyltransferase GcvT [Candidatus Odinarchaeota archaeon]|nr:glycine cleavage system aminomethyltransferase GcvT [Candidatus Odinarchaeota archaeon]
MEKTLKKTHVHDWHVKHARMIEFAGFHMPVWYTSIEDEHMAVRNSVGIFDVTHMGRFFVVGSEATDFLNYVVTRDVKKAANGQALYSVMLNEKGGIVDDLIVYKINPERFLVVVNASNKEKDFNWLKKHATNYDVTLTDRSDEMPMFAIQGPKAEELLFKIVDFDVKSLGKFMLAEGKLLGHKAVIARTGYTGEDGFEVSLYDMPLDESDKVIKIWEDILNIGKDLGIKPCGLGARDSLRLEAGLVLYGNDIDDTTTPIEASIKYALDLDKEDYIGKEVIDEQIKNGVSRIRMGFIMIDKAIPRHDFDVLDSSGNVIGHLTSGGYSPLIKNGIAMGYVPIEFGKSDIEVFINVRGRNKKAKTVKPRRMLKVLRKMSQG